MLCWCHVNYDKPYPDRMRKEALGAYARKDKRQVRKLHGSISQISMQTEIHFFGADKFLFDFAYNAKLYTEATNCCIFAQVEPNAKYIKAKFHNSKSAQVPQAIDKIQIARHLFLDF